MVDETDLRATFFVECEDLLSEIADGLNVLEQDLSDPEAIHSVFRAVHSIKGCAGAFAMNDVVRFAHSFENALDKVRQGEAALDFERTILFQRCGDCLSATLDAAFSDTPCDAEQNSAIIQELDTTFDLPSETAPDTATMAAETFAPAPTAEPLLLEPNAEALIPLALDFLDDGDETPPAADLASPAKAGEEPEAPREPAPSPAPDTPKAGILNAPDPAPKPAPTPAAQKPNVPKTTLRVDADRIDLLINTVGELIINQSTILERFTALEQAKDSSIEVALDEYRQLTSELQERVLAIRAQPVKSLFQRMSRVVREVSTLSGKPARLVTEGEDTEVDKTLVESLVEPLTHMIRNSVDHGLEDEATRASVGKSPIGEVKLSASHASGNVVVEISDDGAGLNRPKIKQIATEKGLIPPDADLTPQEIDKLLFVPGFSTADEVSDLSGRGVGMDVVKNAISKLGGSITTFSTPGKGTTFRVAVPLTLAVMDGMIVKVGTETMVLPISNVIETVKPTAEMIDVVGKSNRVFRFREKYVPILNVASTMRLPPERQTAEGEPLLVVIKLGNENIIALELDDVLDRRQLVIKGLETHCGHVRGVSAAAILGDGKLVLIIDPDALSESQSSAQLSPMTMAVPAYA